MSLRYLLDTNVVSALAGARFDHAVATKVHQVRHECAIPTLVWHELSYGCFRLPQGKRRTDLEMFLQSFVQGRFPFLPYDQPAATWHAKERARLGRVGRVPPFADGQIAAIAHVSALTLVTANTKDFARFEGINVVNWSKSTSSRS